MWHIWQVFRKTFEKCNEDNVFRLGAALAYYSVFSLGPVLVLAVGIAGTLFGEEAARGELARQLEEVVGKAGAEAVQAILANTIHQRSNLAASLTGIVLLLIGSSGGFVELMNALNLIWKVPPSTRNGIFLFFRDRIFSFVLCLAIGFLLLASLVFSAVLSAVGGYLKAHAVFPSRFLMIVNGAAPFALIVFLFALIFKFIPETKVGWREVAGGALLSAVLFTIGKSAISFYLAKTSIASAFGASASLIVVMVWTYYSCLILFLGAEFSYVQSTLKRESQKHQD